MKQFSLLTGWIWMFGISGALVSGAQFPFFFGTSPEQPAAAVDRVIVSLADQAFAAFSGDQLVMRGPISSGMGGYQTRTGTFEVSNKHRQWTSTIYGVPMPNFLRLNGGSMGLHGGYLPGFAASHGCIRLTFADAEKLFEIAHVGTRVMVTEESTPATRGVKQPRSRAIYYRLVGGRKVILSDEEVKRVMQVRSGNVSWVGSKSR